MMSYVSKLVVWGRKKIGLEVNDKEDPGNSATPDPVK